MFRGLLSLQFIRKWLSWDLAIVGVLFIAAAAIRAWGIRWSLPYVGHPDEPTIVNAAVRILKTGDLNPHFYDYPSLVIYIQAVLYKLHLIYGMWRNLYTGVESFPDTSDVFALAPELFIWGRMYSALVGAATVAGLYLLGKAMFGRGAGLAAALLLLTSPKHVESSHYLVTDATMTACAVGTLAASWWLVNRPSARAALLTGALVGLTAAAKYNGVYIGFVAVIAWVLAFKSQWSDLGPRVIWRWLALAVGMILVGLSVFLVTNPYVVLDWDHWSRAFNKLMNDTQPARDMAGAVGSFRAQVEALIESDLIVTVVGVLGAVLLIVMAVRTSDGRLKNAAWLLIPFPLVFILLMSRFELVYSRYLLIDIPFLCLLCGFAASWVAQVISARIPATAPTALRSTTLLAGVLGLLLAVEPGRQMVNWDRYLSMPDSANLAYNWLLEELRAGHRVAVELHPWQTCAPPPFVCSAPDVYTSPRPLTDHPPGWYAERGYDYVMLLGTDRVDIKSFDMRSARSSAALAPYLKLPVVKHFVGDHDGGQGLPVLVFQTTHDGTASMRNVAPTGERFGDVAELYGYAMTPLHGPDAPYDPAAGPPPSRQGYKPGQVLGLSLYLRALKPGNGDPHNWTVSVHLVNEEGAVVAQVDVPPLSSGRVRPVRDWYQNEFLAGAYNVPLPASLPQGTYNVQVNLYDAPIGPSLPVVTSSGETVQFADLGTIAVDP